MAYIGNTPAENFVSVVKQDITGNGGTSYTLNHPVSSPGELEVFVNHVQQEPTTAYTVAGTTLTFTEAVVAGDDIYVVFRGRTMGTVEHPAGAALTATSGTFSGDLTIDNNTLKVDAANNKIGINGIPVNTGASLPIVDLHGGQADNGILIRTGDSNTSTGGGTVLQVGFNTGTGYRHNIRTRHDSGNNVNNAIEFYTWQTGQNSGDLGNLKVLSAGANGVTMPNQPFAALSISNPPAMTTNGGLFTTGSLDANNGNVWNSSTHRFTAPIAGNYMFIVTGYTTFTTGYGYLSLYKNGGNYKTHHYNHNGHQQHTIATLSMAIPLVQNDYLELRRGGGGNGHWQQLYLTIFKAT